jgi:ATP-dependent Lon protease
VILPARNEADFDDVPESIRDEIVLHAVESVNEVLNLALELRAAEGGPEEMAEVA